MKKFLMVQDEKNQCMFEMVLGESKECKENLSNLSIVEEKNSDATLEKHVPFIEELENGYRVKIGKESLHPMTEEHFIEMIEIIVDDLRVYRKYLKPGEEPMAEFSMPKGEKVTAREYCNIHGLWKGTL